MSGDRMNKVVLLANVGNSDVSLKERKSLPDRGENYRWLPRELGEELYNNFNQYANSIEIPLIGPTLEWIMKEEKCEIKDILLYLFASDQDELLTPQEEWQKDTAPFANVIRKYLNRRWQMQKKQVFIENIEGNPADYTNALDFHQKTLVDIKKNLSNHQPYRVYMEVSGGTPAMTAMLILMGVEVFGQDVITLYMDRTSTSPCQISVSKVLFARKTREILLNQIDLYAYNAAQETAKQNGLLLTSDEDRRKLIISLLGYADRRLAFDYKRAREELKDTHAVGNLQVQIRYWQQELIDTEASHNLAELIHSAQIKIAQGEYADFTQRLFRFQEAILRYMAEQMGIQYGNDTAYLSDTWRSEQPGLDAYLKSYQRGTNGKMLPPGTPPEEVKTQKRSLNRYSLGAIVDYFVQQTDWAHWQETVEKIFRFSSVADLRNRGIAGHGFEGIGREDIEDSYGDNIEQLIIHLKEIYKDVFNEAIDNNPYETINKFIRELLQ